MKVFFAVCSIYSSPIMHIYTIRASAFQPIFVILCCISQNLTISIYYVTVFLACRILF